MSPRWRTSTRWLLLLVAVSALVVWLGKALLFPPRLTGQRFALIGRVDLDRDGRDDRDRLKKLILSHGGSVDYDLPPAGPASGKLGPMIGWYVVDERSPAGVPTAKHKAEKASAIAKARLDGIRPLPIDRLLSRLGIK